ncbi:putative beta-lysine N-acetyltransferase [Alkalihalobacillus deserti]|uniref:putative beta-lysine N-acetyltransferase n=1 Tax=Alkalihalobacillus deserti TaxID=2879466 RepID=UPI001D14ED62|nr:putative beta-lysine N-acetyltransferase [Alkalihalobacillus deserti]
MQIVKNSSCEVKVYGKPILIEPVSKRMKIYKLPNLTMIDQFISKLKRLGKQRKCDKLIFYVKEAEKHVIKKHMTCLEGKIESFFNDEDAFIYALFLNPERHQIHLSEAEMTVLDLIKKRNKGNSNYQLPKDYKMRWAKKEDAPQMAKLYKTVFKSYPTPMNDSNFIIDMMSSDVYFFIVEKDSEIVSACSADLLPEFKSAELSDCVTYAEHRSKQLLTYQVAHLIPRIKEMGINTLFSYSRSVSIGMNLVNIKHDFQYGGRMIRNSNIAGSMENMNIWYRKL